MTKQVQLRRGTTAEHQVFTGAEGELTIDTTRDIAIVHDGVTAGGHELVGLAATGQTIVNKDGLAIGSSTLIGGAPLSVVGNSYISGISTLSGAVSIGGTLNVQSSSVFAGIGTDKNVTIGSGNTDFVVTGTARITETLEIGTSTITLNGNTNTISAETAQFTRLSVTGENVTVATFSKNVTNNVSAGSTVIPLNNTTSLLVGDLVNIAGILTHVPITGIGTTTVSPFYETVSTTSISTTVSTGSTIIGVTTDIGISTSNYISIAGIITNVPIVGFTTTSLGDLYTFLSQTGTASTVSAGSTIFPVNNITNVSSGDYFSLKNGFGTTVIDRAPIISLGTTSGTSYYLTINTTSISTTVSAGSTIISIGNTTGVTTTNFISVSGIITNVPIDDVILTGVTSSYQLSNETTVSSTVSSGSTVISVASTSGIVVGSAIDITGIFNKVPVTGIGVTTITIGFGNTYNGTISSGLAVTSFLVSETNNYAVLIGIGSTSSQEISTGTQVNINSYVTPSIPTVIIGIANTISSNVGVGSTVIFERLSNPVGPAVLIGTGNTYNAPITVGTAVSYTFLNNVRQVVRIGTSNTSTSAISAGSTATIIRQEEVQSDLNVNNLKAIGISTIEQAIISGLNYPLGDGFKGQVLATDGAGNLGFATGGGSGGSEVVLRVSSKVGSDDNDGKILPLRTIKKATQLASKVGKPVTIFVETGEYVEDNPILVYDSISVIGDSLRNIIVRPLNASKDLFKVRNGCYITGMSFNDYVDARGVPQHTYNYSVSFDDPYDTNVNRAGYAATYASLNVTNATYQNTTGFTTITVDGVHELAREYSVKLTGVGWTCGYDEIGISTFVYDNVSGVSTITFFSDALFTPSGSGDTQKGYTIGDKLFLHNLPFSCGAEHAGVTTTIFPYTGLDPTYGAVYPITGINTAAKTVTITGAASTIPHIYEGYASVAISTFSYDHVSGIATATTTTPHGLLANDSITLAGLKFSCASGAGTTTIFPDGTVTAYSPDGYTFKVSSATTSTFTYNVGVSTIAHTYVTGGTVKKVPTVQEVWYYPDYHKDGQNEFGVVAVGGTNVFTIRGQTSGIQHYYTQGGTIQLSRPIINKSPYIQNCSILSSLGGNGILVDGDKVANVNKGIIPELGEIPVVGDQPTFGKSMVAATFTMVSFGGIGWRTINDGYAQVVSCFQIFCRYGSLTQSGGYLSITNSATNFGDKALRSTGFSRNSFAFDRGRIVANGTQDGLQTLRTVGLGRSDQDLYVLRFINNANEDQTSNFKPLTQFEEFTSAGVNTTTNVFTIAAHPFVNGDSVVYNGNEQASPPQVLGGLVNDAIYYIEYIDASNFRLFEDDSLRVLVDVYGTFSGVGTFTKNNQEFYNYEIIEAHNSYQKLSLAGIGSTAIFVSGRAVTQGSASGYALTFSQSTKELIVSVESVGGVRNFFSTSTTLDDHSPTPISIGLTAVSGITTYWTLNFKVESTNAGNLISGINSLTENYQLHLHRPSIINSSAHTWEYAGSGVDYNALPQNGGQSRPNSEQVSELGGRVYASGTNELGDFKIGTQITAYNRTGNIIFNNKVTIGELASIRLSLSGGVAVEEFSTDTGLGENETGGPKNSRVSTQLAVKSFLTNRLGSFIDKQVSTNAVPNAVVQLNAQGQINADLIPPQVVSYNLTNVGGGRTVLANQIPAVNILQGDTVVEPDDSFVLVNDVLSQYLILDSSTEDYTFQNGDVITSTLTEAITGIVTAPPERIGIGTEVQEYVGYGTTGLVKGVLLDLQITNGGSGYTNPGIYTAVSLTSITGAGTSAYGTVTIGAGNTATIISAYAGGKGYAVGDVLNAADGLVGGRSGGAQFQATVTSVQTRLYLKLTNNQKFAGSTALPDYISDGNAVSISTSLTDNYVVDIDPTDVGTGGDIDFANDRIVVGSGHQFGSGDPIVYDTNGGSMISASGSGIINLNTYYTKPVGVSSVELYYDYSLNNQLDFTGSGIGTHTLRRQVVNVNAEKLVIVGHGFTVGDPFRIFGATPTGITTHEFYFIGAVTPNAFTLHETQADALLSVNGVSFNPVGMSGTSSGITTLTNQNIRYRNHVNTSSTNINNYSLLARDSIDASNIVSGVIVTSRLGTGTANSDTVLTGTSEYKKAVFSVGIGTTQPISATATSSQLAPGGIGINTYFGNVNLVLNRVSAVGTIDFTTLGVARFKNSTFAIGEDGQVTIKAGSAGDIDANSFQGQGPSFYLNSENHTNAVPVTRGGTGLTGVPAAGALLVGNGAAFNLTTSPTITGITSFTNTTQSTSTTTGAVIISGGLGVAKDVYIGGTLNAISKSFLIDHPTKPGYKLQYGSLEGPENGVYVRGRLTGSDTIELPDYWTGLVDENTITVTLTPIGTTPILHSVTSTNVSEVKVASQGEIDCYYVVYAERKDTEKLVVEFAEG